MNTVKERNIENVVIDEANERKYVIMAERTLSDGETYKAIRQALLKRGGKPIAKGETLVLTFE
jgi:hypothetical protein